MATTFALPAVKNKIPDISNLVKKKKKRKEKGLYAKKSGIQKKVTDHDHDKYITISKFNQLTAEANLVQPKQI